MLWILYQICKCYKEIIAMTYDSVLLTPTWPTCIYNFWVFKHGSSGAWNWIFVKVRSNKWIFLNNSYRSKGVFNDREQVSRCLRGSSGKWMDYLLSCGNQDPHASNAISHMAFSVLPPESYSATTGKEIQIISKPPRNSSLEVTYSFLCACRRCCHLILEVSCT